MSMLFGSEQPQPQPVPVAPTQDPNAEAKRLQAERDSAADVNASGRRSTMAAGMTMAADNQYQSGLMSVARRNAAAKTLTG